MRFGEVAFSGSRFIFWCVAPILLVAAVGLPLTIRDWTPFNVMFTTAWIVGCSAAVLAIHDAGRFPWAARTVTGIIFTAFLLYAVDAVLRSNEPLAPTKRSEASPWNALRGLIAIGLPALWYTLHGRFSLRRDDPRAPAEPEG
jgi:hypothetical protein